MTAKRVPTKSLDEQKAAEVAAFEAAKAAEVAELEAARDIHEDAAKTLREKQHDALKDLRDRNAQVAAMIEREVEAADATADDESDIDYGPDFDFLNHDPHDMRPYAEMAGVTLDDDKYAYRWGTKDPRLWPRRMAEGWRPIPGMNKGDSIAMKMPKARAARLKDAIAQRVKLRRQATSRRFDQEVKQAGGKPFDDDRPIRGG